MSNEAENVVAEVIEEQDASSLTVAYKPSVIEANFDALEAHVRKTVDGLRWRDPTTSPRRRTIAEAQARPQLPQRPQEGDRRAPQGREARVQQAARRLREALQADHGHHRRSRRQHQGAARPGRGRAQGPRLRQVAGALRGVRRLLAPVVPYERFHEPAVAQQDLRRDQGLRGA